MGGTGTFFRTTKKEADPITVERRKIMKDYRNYFTENSVQIPETEYSTLGTRTNLR